MTVSAHRRTLIFLATLLLALVPIFSSSLWQEVVPALSWPGLFVTQLFVLTWFWRTVPLHLVAAAFLLGCGPVMLAVLLLQAPVVALLEYNYPLQYWFGDLIGQRVDVAAVFLAPPTEEFLKILPILVVVRVGPWRHIRYSASPADFALLGAAVGAGFEFIETVWKGVYSVDLYSYARIAEHISPQVGPFYVLPTLEWPERSDFAWFGHSGTTSALALALGLALWLSPKSGRWWSLPVLVGGLVTFEHFLSNLGEPSAWWLQILSLLDARGLLSSFLFVGGLVWASVLSEGVLRRYRTVDEEAAFGLREAGRVLAAQPVAFVGQLPLVLLLLRLSRATAYGLHHFGRTRRRSRPTALSLHGLRQTTLALKKSLLPG